eukprot:364256-Chlamydomonas_euryale.AAC.5
MTAQCSRVDSHPREQTHIKHASLKRSKHAMLEVERISRTARQAAALVSHAAAAGPASEARTQRWISRNKAAGTGRPQAASSARPQAASKGRPQAASTARPQTASKGRPQAASTRRPQTASKGRPQAASTRRPQAESTGQPQAANPGKPQAASTGSEGAQAASTIATRPKAAVRAR